MKTYTLIAVTNFTLALLAYTVGTIAQQRSRRITGSVVGFLTVGVVLDIVATVFMILGSGKIVSLHGLLGYSALAGMLAEVASAWRWRLRQGEAPITLRVLDIQNRAVKVLFSGRAPLGELEYTWNNTDSTGKQVPSGVYTMEFRLGGSVKNAYTLVVNGAVSAVTDSLGHYVIPNDTLPVDFSPAPLYSSDGRRFLGNYQITPYILLDFNVDFLRRVSLTLKKDEITRFDFRI